MWLLLFLCIYSCFFLHIYFHFYKTAKKWLFKKHIFSSWIYSQSFWIYHSHGVLTFYCGRLFDYLLLFRTVLSTSKNLMFFAWINNSQLYQKCIISNGTLRILLHHSNQLVNGLLYGLLWAVQAYCSRNIQGESFNIKLH